MLRNAAVLLLLFSLSCGKTDSSPVSPAVTNSPAPLSSVRAPEPSVVPSVSVSAPSTKVSNTTVANVKLLKIHRSKVEPILKKEARQSYQNHLDEGRTLAQAKKWTEAISRYEEALRAKPEDPVALAELGYAAYYAGDLDRARSFNTRALKVATEPGLRASILFNEGMVDEKKGDKDAARKHYETSLSLRPNATVQTRLEKLGPAGACDARFPSRKDLEGCLRSQASKELTMFDPAKPTVLEEKEKGPGGLSVIRWGQQDGPEHPYFLIAEGSWGARRIAILGQDFEPGAFGVHNEGNFSRFESLKVGSRDLVLVWWGQSNYDSNMAGLQADTYTSKNLTVCVLGGASGEPVCPVSVPLEETTENLYPIEPTEDAMRAEIDEMKKKNPPFEKVEKASFQISEEGLFKVREIQGKRAHLATYVKGIRLF